MKIPRLLALLIIAFAAIAAAAEGPAAGVYHEASCPSVDPNRMTKMTRGTAVAGGYLPAADCHPARRVTVLGESWPGALSPAPVVRREEVNGYVRKNGTVVDPYTRRPPRSAD